MIRLLLSLPLTVVAVAARAQASRNLLPDPSGPHGIGRVTYHWIDSSRAAFVDGSVQRRREIMVDVWYPAPRVSGPTAPYLPNLPLLRRVFGDSLLRRRFAPAYAIIQAGQLDTHAHESVAVRCPQTGCPLLIFSHGGGVDRSFYAAQYEDLASHGYIVAAIAHTFDTHVVVFPDGRVVPYAPQPRDTTAPDSTLPRWRRDLVREARSQAYVRGVIAVEASDLRFVIGRLTQRGDEARLAPSLAGKVDRDRIGALGHSAGGEAAALACQLDLRIKACLNQDGVMHGLPFSRDSAGKTMAQPFLYFTRALPRPADGDDVLAAMQITRAELDSLIEDVATGPVRLLSGMPAGAFRVSLTAPGVSHMSFSDEPLLQAAGDSVKLSRALHTLHEVAVYTRAFFDLILRGDRHTVLQNGPRADSTVRLERFDPRRPGG